jgi:hypothetical protein
MPAWDEAWRQEALKAGFGNVLEAIWSTFNSPGHFATGLIPFILLLLISQSPLKIPVVVVLILDLLLTRVRTAFIASCIGLILLAGTLKPRFQMRLILAFLVIVLCVFPLANIGLFPNLFNRVQTLSNVQGDGSFQARQNLYRSATESALINPIGYGMGSLNLADSGIILIFYEMGWLGAAPFLGGLILLFLNTKKSSINVNSSFEKAALASSYAILAMLPNGNLFGGGGFGGILVWAFPSIVMAGNQYYRYQPSDLSIRQSNYSNPK